jgi:hypothetical protein
MEESANLETLAPLQYVDENFIAPHQEGREVHIVMIFSAIIA